MLDYFKKILVKVSFDLKLFEKELLKAINSLLAEEINDLKSWCYKNFSGKYEPVLAKCFVNR